jgi:hypothetical protein
LRGRQPAQDIAQKRQAIAQNQRTSQSAEAGDACSIEKGIQPFVVIGSERSGRVPQQGRGECGLVDDIR